MTRVDKSLLTKNLMKYILLRLYGQRCFYCDQNINIKTVTIDHIIPISVDETMRYDVSNYLPACQFCNYTRGSMPIEEFCKYISTDEFNEFLATKKE